MSVRVDVNNPDPIQSFASTAVASVAKGMPSVSPAGSNQVTGDAVNLSEISGLVAKAMDQPEVRMDKVQAIRAQIAAGTYEVNLSKVADALISSALAGNI